MALPRIVVAQRCLRDRPRRSLPEAMKDALPVGVQRVEADASYLIVMVKATLTWDEPEGEEDQAIVRLCELQEPLELERKSQRHGAAEDELEYPSDFVPGRGGTDVTLVGHAYKHEGMAQLHRDVTRIEARLSVDNWSRSITAVAGGDAQRLPLTGAYTRSFDGSSAARSFAPMARPAWEIRMGETVDLRHFNRAPPEQRLLSIAPDAEITLEGMSPSRKRVVLPLPALAPRVFADPRFGGRREIPMSRDTIWIDADAKKIVLVWRGQGVLPSLDEPSIEQIVVSLEETRRPRPTAEIRRHLARGAFFYAVEAEDLEEDAPPLPRRDAVLEAARYRAWQAPGAPDPVFSKEQYDAIQAELAKTDAPREAVLARAGIDEYGWLVEQRAWSAKWAGEARHNLEARALPARREVT